MKDVSFQPGLLFNQLDFSPQKEYTATDACFITDYFMSLKSYLEICPDKKLEAVVKDLTSLSNWFQNRKISEKHFLRLDSLMWSLEDFHDSDIDKAIMKIAKTAVLNVEFEASEKKCEFG